MPTANEAWRHDPERRAEWEDALNAQREAWLRAQELVEQAEAMLHGALLRYDIEDYSLYSRGYRAVRDAQTSLESNAQWVVEPHTETYLGNKAVFGRPK